MVQRGFSSQAQYFLVFTRKEWKSRVLPAASSFSLVKNGCFLLGTKAGLDSTGNLQDWWELSVFYKLELTVLFPTWHRSL